MLSEGKTFAIIREQLGISNGMITNARNWSPKVESRGRRRKTNKRQDNAITRILIKHPSITFSQIRDELDLPIATSTIRKRLIAVNLKARSPRKVPLLKKVHLKNRLPFAKKYINEPDTFWRNILWTDETKRVQFDHGKDKQYVRRPPNQQFNEKYTVKTIKHGGLRLMLWGCFGWNGVEPLVRIVGKMDATYYVNNILEAVMLPYAEEEMPLRWVFQQDNGSKHTSKKAKRWLQDNNIHVMDWTAQSPDLIPIEHLWIDVKKDVRDARPKNLEELWLAAKNTWKNISLYRFQTLIASMRSRCAEVISNRRGATSY